MDGKGRESKGRDGRGREGRERGGRARLGYLSRGPQVPSYATGYIVAFLRVQVFFEII